MRGKYLWKKLKVKCQRDWAWRKDSDTSHNHSDREKQGRAGTSFCPVQCWEGPRTCCEARKPRLVSKAVPCSLEISLLWMSGVLALKLRTEQPAFKEAAQWQGLSVLCSLQYSKGINAVVSSRGSNGENCVLATEQSDTCHTTEWCMLVWKHISNTLLLKPAISGWRCRSRDGAG